MAEECKHYDENIARCNCTYEPCERKGYCCECIKYHMRMGEAPACFFTKDAEKTYNRSLRYLAKLVGS